MFVWDSVLIWLIYMGKKKKAIWHTLILIFMLKFKWAVNFEPYRTLVFKIIYIISVISLSVDVIEESQNLNIFCIIILDCNS